MGASASQIASARALAQSRGYDPNLVDADNADRANSAFPIQANRGSGAGGSSAGAGGSTGGGVGGGVGGSGSPSVPGPALPSGIGDGSGGLAGIAPASAMPQAGDPAMQGFASAMGNGSVPDPGPGFSSSSGGSLNPRLGTRTPSALQGFAAAGLRY